MVASAVIMFLNNVSCWDNYAAMIEIDDSERTPRLATKTLDQGETVHVFRYVGSLKQKYAMVFIYDE